MKAIKITSFGGPEVLTLTAIARPVAASQQVVIAIEAAGVGTVDVLVRKGLLHGSSDPDFIPGIEVAGTVIEVGEDVDISWIGKRVFAITTVGGYAEFIAVEADLLVAIPDELTAAQAVALGVNALVGVFSLQRTNCKNGDRVLLRGAGGGIGSITAQLALRITPTVTVVSSKEEQLKQLGVKQFLKADETNAVFDIVLDPVAGADIDSYVNLLAPNGSYLMSGAAAGFPSPEFGNSWIQRFLKSLSFICLSLNSISQQERNTALTEIFALCVDGKITSVIDSIYCLDNAAEAHRHLESGKVFGKIILAIK